MSKKLKLFLFIIKKKFFTSIKFYFCLILKKTETKINEFISAMLDFLKFHLEQQKKEWKRNNYFRKFEDLYATDCANWEDSKKVCLLLRHHGAHQISEIYSLKDYHYPLASPEEIFTKLDGGKFFPKIDLSDAYLQILVEEECSKLLCINTHRGLYKIGRFPFGVKVAPTIF